MSEIIKKNLSEIIDLIKKKEIKSEELANLYIDKVNKSKKLNSYITTCFEHTIQKAKEFLYDNFIGAKEKLVLIDSTMIPRMGHCDRWNNYILMYSN